MNYRMVIENEIITNAKNEEELKEIFNNKLATLILYYQKWKEALW